MLVLSRKRNEIVTIGDTITVMVVEIRGDKVRLGIVAPTNVAVHRLEVYEAIQAEGCRPSNGRAVGDSRTNGTPSSPPGTDSAPPG